MIFSTWSFALFFIVVFCAYWALPLRTGRHVLLLAASYFFYMCWNPWMITMIIGITVYDYIVGVFLHRSANERFRKWLLVASLAGNLGLLCVFKYFNFFILSARTLLDAIGLHTDLHALSIILPVGISFHTFQTMSYTVDVYRRRVQPARSFLEFALFVAFFPQMVAGPIVLAADFLPQLAEKKRFNWDRMASGSVLFLVGLTKKLLIADQLAALVDPVFADPTRFSTRDLWLGMFCYGGQIFCDFSGYSDMAIATACVLGFDLRANFASPYLAISPSDFWRRWHISLSSWLRDFLYIPLGGSRGGRWKTARNLMITMLLGGLWHGASWTFVIWGAIHGTILIIGKALQKGVRPLLRAARSRHPQGVTLQGRIAGWGLTLLAIHVAWVFFRCQPTAPGATDHVVSTAQALQKAVYFTTHLFVPASVEHPTWLPNKEPMVALLLLMIAMQIYEEWVRRGRRPLRLPAPVAGAAYGLWILLLLIFSPENTDPFIYFQF